jgi:hypothetical protein
MQIDKLLSKKERDALRRRCKISDDDLMTADKAVVRLSEHADAMDRIVKEYACCNPHCGITTARECYCGFQEVLIALGMRQRGVIPTLLDSLGDEGAEQ